MEKSNIATRESNRRIEEEGPTTKCFWGSDPSFFYNEKRLTLTTKYNVESLRLKLINLISLIRNGSYDIGVKYSIQA